jgi:hypothetical protein
MKFEVLINGEPVFATDRIENAERFVDVKVGSGAYNPIIRFMEVNR